MQYFEFICGFFDVRTKMIFFILINLSRYIKATQMYSEGRFLHRSFSISLVYVNLNLCDNHKSINYLFEKNQLNMIRCTHHLLLYLRWCLQNVMDRLEMSNEVFQLISSRRFVNLNNLRVHFYIKWYEPNEFKHRIFKKILLYIAFYVYAYVNYYMLCVLFFMKIDSVVLTKKFVVNYFVVGKKWLCFILFDTQI